MRVVRTSFFILYLEFEREINAMKWMNKKGEMEMWQIILIILAVILLFVMIMLFVNWSGSGEGLLKRLGDLG